MFLKINLTFSFLIFIFANLYAQEEAEGYSIACELSEINSNTAFLGPDFSNLRPSGANNCTFDVTYSNFSSDAKAAFQAAIEVWQKVLVSRVPIKVTATWESINSTTLATSGAKKVYRNFGGNSVNNVYYPSALAEAIIGKNLNGTEADIQITINKNVSWSYATDGNREAFKYDLMTVVLHELAHGLGFTTSMKLAGTNETQCQWGIDGYPLIYDIFVQNANNVKLTNSAVIGNPSTELKAAITGGFLFFNIASGFYSKDLPKLYAPTVFRSGGSISHLDELKYPKGTENSMMSPQIGAAEINHFPGTVILAILNQIGWGVMNFAGSVITSVEPSQNDKKFFVYPNPTSDYLNVIIPEIVQNEEKEIGIYDLNGRRIRMQNSQYESIVKIDLQNISSGNYILKIGNYQSFHFVKY